ncbi:MAG: nucleotide sugar dehydrogenase [Planctomycetota bacterium]|nr:nucleotide sugar dehydrogenase [Planctomycetota bacterium]
MSHRTGQGRSLSPWRPGQSAASPDAASSAASHDAPSALPRLCVVGLGKLGSPIAACLAAKGFTVVGVDTDPAKIDAIKQGKSPVFEPGLDEMLARTAGRLTATADLAAATHATDVTFIIVPTPSEADGGFSLRFALPACRTIGQALRSKETPHLVVMTSTVMPGATDGPLRQALEQSSGRRCGDGWGLCYSPEFVALGSVIRDFLSPDFLLIGQSDAASGDRLESILRQTVENKPAVARVDSVNAELTKLAVNTFVTTKITYANMIAEICHRLPGANVDQVTAALGLDTRIGAKYLRGAVGYGGPCFPRDNAALSSLARELGAQARLAEVVDQTNRHGVQRIADLVYSHLPSGPTRGRVAVLGLSYKPHTDVTEQSQGLLLARTLADAGLDVTVFDPAAMNNAKAVLHDAVKYAADLRQAVEAGDVVVAITPWEEFKTIEPTWLSRPASPRVLIDCWRYLDAAALSAVTNYVPLGIGPEAPAAEAIDRSLRVA